MCAAFFDDAGFGPTSRRSSQSSASPTSVSTTWFFDRSFHRPGVDDEGGYSDASGSDSEEELEEYRQLFDSIDRDHDGYITLQEMVFAEKKMRRQRGDVVSEFELRLDIHDFLEEADLDNNYVLDFNEFAAAMEARKDPELVAYSRARARCRSSSRTKRGRPLLKSASSEPSRPRTEEEKTAIIKRFGLALAIAPDEPQSAEHAAKWEAIKHQRIDVAEPESREQLARVFRTLETNNAPGFVDVSNVLALEQRLAEVQSRPFDAEERLEDLRQAAVLDQLDEQGFCDVMARRQLTHEDLRTIREILSESLKRDQSGISSGDLKASLESLREQIRNMGQQARSGMPASSGRGAAQRRGGAGGPPGRKGPESPSHSDLLAEFSFDDLPANTPPDAIAAENQFMQEQLDRLKEQLLEAVGFCDHLMEKYSDVEKKLAVKAEAVCETEKELHKQEKLLELLPKAQAVEAAASTNGTAEAEQAKMGPSTAARRRIQTKDFFFLTCFSLKCDLEARFKAHGLRPPALNTRQLYEKAMKEKVPWQFFYRWLKKQIDISMGMRGKGKRTRKTAHGSLRLVTRG